MTVKQLIAKLLECNQDALIRLEYLEKDNDTLTQREVVKIIDNDIEVLLQ